MKRKKNYDSSTAEKAAGADCADPCPCSYYTLRPENNPADCHKEECQKHLASFFPSGQKSSLRHEVQMFPVLSSQDERKEKQRVISSPDQKGPIRTMPETPKGMYT